ncbi:cytochrome C552 [Falsiroseomonas bella]|uniref:Cytochrome C552 n=1 Tax=Falsiroseomonas bella TaxID=2184016 RepID=A0A317F697_9PROT|nr:cytochrome c [Falsiroseomonas bella]PWS34710.1 cytochrome C552 [Falsiroseomonas bella]
MRWMLPLLVLAMPIAAQAADPAEGRRLAEQWCASCHLIARGGPGPVTDAVPAFHVIAARPGRTEEAIATFLRTPHAGMPDHGLTLRQAQDLAAYVKAQGGAQ